MALFIIISVSVGSGVDHVIIDLLLVHIVLLHQNRTIPPIINLLGLMLNGCLHGCIFLLLGPKLAFEIM